MWECRICGRGRGRRGEGGEVVGCEIFAVNQVSRLWERRFGSLGLGVVGAAEDHGPDVLG